MTPDFRAGMVRAAKMCQARLHLLRAEAAKCRDYDMRGDLVAQAMGAGDCAIDILYDCDTTVCSPPGPSPTSVTPISDAVAGVAGTPLDVIK